MKNWCLFNSSRNRHSYSSHRLVPHKYYHLHNSRSRWRWIRKRRKQAFVISLWLYMKKDKVEHFIWTQRLHLHHMENFLPPLKLRFSCWIRIIFFSAGIGWHNEIIVHLLFSSICVFNYLCSWIFQWICISTKIFSPTTVEDEEKKTVCFLTSRFLLQKLNM